MPNKHGKMVVLIPTDLHLRLDAVAKSNGKMITRAATEAVEAYVAAKWSNLAAGIYKTTSAFEKSRGGKPSPGSEPAR